MRTAMAETSLEAYDGLRDTGKLNERQAQVLAVIQKGRDYSLQEISLLCGLPINIVSGRVNELKKEPLNKLEQADKRKCSLTGYSCHPVRLSIPDGA